MRHFIFTKSFFLVWLGMIAVAFTATAAATHCPSWGVLADNDGVSFRIYSANAERIEVSVFKGPDDKTPAATFLLDKKGDGTWQKAVAEDALRKLGLDPKVLYYGYRAWGPNWKYDANWKPGTEIGCVKDVDEQGNRFNPNKMLVDPYALEWSHDPMHAGVPREEVYFTGSGNRAIDTGPLAPKSIYVRDRPLPKTAHLTRGLKDDVIYELHVEGFTANDPSVPEDERGTFKGLTRKIEYLKQLGITAVEILPPTQFEDNWTRDPQKLNYWGYMPLSYHALHRNYATKAAQAKPGGITREFVEMVDALHAAGMKVIVDMVYNHTGEAGPWGGYGEKHKLISFNGLDMQTYYQLGNDPRYVQDNTGCGGNFNCGHPVVAEHIMDSLKHFRASGVDGVRFDLAPPLGNQAQRGSYFDWNPENHALVLRRAERELPVRPVTGGQGMDLIAEPWGIGDETQRFGQFGGGWSEWNPQYRDTVRGMLNKLGYGHPTPGKLAAKIAGSADVFGGSGRKPGNSINMISVHDGFTLADLFRFDKKNNDQGPPFGPSDGGENNNISWSQQEGNAPPALTAARQRKAARNAMAIQMLSIGTPIFNMGDEFQRSLNGNNNAYNVREGNHVNWEDLRRNAKFFDFTSRLIGFRNATPALRPDNFLTGSLQANGLHDISWHRADGHSAEGDYMDSTTPFLGYRVNTEGDAAKRSMYVAINYGSGDQAVQLPPAAPGKQWYLVGDTGMRFESSGNAAKSGQEVALTAMDGGKPGEYKMEARSITWFVEK